MNELYPNNSIQNLEWNLSPKKKEVVFSFELVSHGKIHGFRIQNADAVRQLQEMYQGKRIRAELFANTAEIDVWKQPGDRYRMECHLDTGEVLQFLISQKEMDKLFYIIHQIHDSALWLREQD